MIYILLSAIIVILVLLMINKAQTRRANAVTAKSGPPRGKGNDQKETLPPVKFPDAADQEGNIDKRPTEFYGGTMAEENSSFMNDGILHIFGDNGSPPDKTSLPMELEDVSPDVLENVRQQLANLRDIDAIQKLQKILSHSDSAMSEITRLIVRNPVLSARILQIANSPYYGLQQKLNSISHAIMIIGMNNLKAILYHDTMLHAFGEKGFQDQHAAMQALWRHMRYTSICASFTPYLVEGLNMGVLFTLGLLHDVGKLIIVRLKPLNNWDVPRADSYPAGFTVADEEAVYGINHALVGQLALRHWGLSSTMVKATALHHSLPNFRPEELGMNGEDLRHLLALFLANQIAHIFAAEGNEESFMPETLHSDYYHLVNRKGLTQLLKDKTLIGQLVEARAIASI